MATVADVDTGEDGTLNAGDVAMYSMQVSNPGNTCLMDIAVRDKDDRVITCDESYKGQKPKPCIGQVSLSSTICAGHVPHESPDVGFFPKCYFECVFKGAALIDDESMRGE